MQRVLEQLSCIVIQLWHCPEHSCGIAWSTVVACLEQVVECPHGDLVCRHRPSPGLWYKPGQEF